MIIRSSFSFRNRCCRGFTLIELVVVIIIMACLFGMAVPRFGNMIRRQKIDLASRKVAADIRFAQSQAIRNRADRTVRFFISLQYYKLSEEKNFDNPNEPYKGKFDKPPYEGVRLKSAGFGEKNYIVFNRLGIPESGGTVELTNGTESAVITISATTGRVTRTIIYAMDTSGG